MAQKTFSKEDFVQNNEKEYQLGFKVSEIGKGSNLIVERLNEKGEYEIVQSPLRKLNDQIFIIWDSPFNGRILFDV
ncbi:glutathione synthase [Chryseobacterium arthrosphaerae]|uniref:Glutathione synthase n=2 Tax=Chryseobacterium arthrosphaerae TaxID=651561 RepID=A0A1B8ZUE6_9FLAO|nr:glutathione synthase [Chryseobacterium arthrosphaerae]AYZ13649.1 glutathione synthase [Chryseobacterium arthrosphaerae]MDG4653360.1 glutathione synthase [Chryseobacterium arthrosphaerae]OCA75215.1 glutathione synthase [Chryseobacterium arthrosphaerae]QUY54477.1 glutathione synthase [Chryseobacterium arthrosphaerae]RTZ49829.1 glutathione synthase [Chryseobacterium arthrosphaerae]